MNTWLQQLEDALGARASQSLRRSLQTVRVDGRHVIADGAKLINLAGNDYLALSSHPTLKAAAMDAVQRFGVGAGASRLVTGHQPAHVSAERAFAAFKHAEAALLCPTGYMANLAALTALADTNDVICIDKLCHASLIDAAAASGATVRVFPHRGYDKLRRLLERSADRRRRFIVTDSIFSMDGTTADLPRLCQLRDAHEAILVIDEAHGTGVLGAEGSGLAEAQGVADAMDVVVSTASKALGGLGGVITARRVVIDSIVNHGRSFIYTTAVPPVQAACVEAAVGVLRDEPERRQRLQQISRRVREALQACGWSSVGWLEPHGACDTPILPLVVGSAEAALALASQLRDRGFHAPAIRPPTVPDGRSRVRISLRCDLSDDDVARLIEACRDNAGHATS